MSGSGGPLVSVVTPVYNGAVHVAECIGSVRAQTYGNWEHVIVDNRSTDATPEIAREWAERDDRIRLHRNDEFLEMIPNWNHALRRMSPEAVYCKVVHADDWLYPECLERMVGAAESHPPVDLVGAYTLRGRRVRLDGLEPPVPDGAGPPVQVVSGRRLCRRLLLDELDDVFGSPTAVLVRAAAVRERDPFYDAEELHADTKACFDLLREGDFGFVHQVLSYTRMHEESVTVSYAGRLKTWKIMQLGVLQEYGPVFLEHDELERRRQEALDAYYRFLARHWRRPRDGEFWRFHRSGLERVGLPLDRARLARAVARHFVDRLRNPLRTLRSRLVTSGGSGDG